jgi:hypothetical protein
VENGPAYSARRRFMPGSTLHPTQTQRIYFLSGLIVILVTNDDTAALLHAASGNLDRIQIHITSAS